MDSPPAVDLAGILPAIREFMQRDVVARAEQAFLHQPFRVVRPQLETLRHQVQAWGLWAPHVPVAWGGLGLPLRDFAHVSEVLGRSPIGHYLFNCQAPDVGNMELLLTHGTPDQQERYLGPLVRGEIRSCFSMTEPANPGSNPVWLDTTATRDGADYVINGHKWFTSAADGAAFAIVMAITNPEARPHARASQVIVPTDTPGFIRMRNIPVMGEPGEDYASHAEIRYENCRVPQTHLLGAEGAGFALAQERLGPGRIHHCMRWIGICERAFDLMCSRAVQRELAPGMPLGSRQTVQNWIAESRAEINAARFLVLDAAAKIDQAGATAAREEISLIKFYVAGVLGAVLDRAIQVHGALGLTDDIPLAYWYRHERGARIYDGPDEVHKSVVARQILRNYGLDVPRE
ncbi:MAG TPA: acyl-CoA dehydrogenase family protein [Chloroflexia bacterium]|nr:acyl-CoA dehydrogenase family protein [Chloroflexia bacterium]